MAASHCHLLLAASHRNHLFARHHTGEDLLVVDDAVAAPDTTMHHLVVVDAVAAPDTTMHHLVVVDAVTAPITTPSSSCGIAPQPATSGIAPPMAFISHGRPPRHMESTASPPSQPLPPPSTTAATIAAGTVVAATDQQGSDANCWRRSSRSAASSSTSSSLTKLSCGFSLSFSLKNTRTHTYT
ncbi:hypothetical protein CFC21_074138 [Triticum aestivum]|uniref:Uncharacterized protein n=2 Tax=Triticum aestivum TaxID=4565 RepID=A0A3B6LVD7_WHEAT|nr:hypothetical protein CFC21_074138 [Triticum aestivum]